MASTTSFTEEEIQQTAVDIARQYLHQTKHWKPEDYYLEIVSIEKKGEAPVVVLDSIYQDDLRASQRGGGQSVQLHIDVGQRNVVREMSFQ